VRREVDGGLARGRLRLWTAPDGPGGVPIPTDGLCVEWAGQVGHPSSYALLGGRVSDGKAGLLKVRLTGPYVDSPAGAADVVEFGLPEDYAVAVGRGVDGAGEVEVTLAAHGRAGSSPVVFARVGRLLAVFLRDGVPADDADVWRAWAVCQSVG
jgi:hypothetical protein